MKIEMSPKQATLVHIDEDYIDMELTSPSNFLSYSFGSPPNNPREFEFQMSSISNEKDSKTTPADDLFYKGKLLPLHNPPRLQMVQNLLQTTNLEHSTSTSTTFPFTPPTFSTYTPLDSCNISSSESCRVSSEVNPDEYSFEMNPLVVTHSPQIKSWPKKLKLMNHLLFGQKLKASKAYLKSLFNKSGCSDKPSCANDPNKVNRRKNKNPFEVFYEDDKKQMKREIVEDDFISHRKSFSGVVQRQYCGNKSSSLSTSSSGSSSNSSSFSFSSAGYYDLQLFKRSISANYELEGSIEGAIAHCKQSQSQSQQQCCSKNGSDDATKVEVCEDKESLSE
ncbi:probable membrane-associated kinase regulator 4 [Vicia villosa]|uniref:probable membrane-associated kinase regulator 4 n=1 Tax=Vicia villosa TaxID=3911 RepID=UPI00273AF78A|nr:probable membrane-associated kinase regulator 4 [Vicia villosa]